MSLILEKRKIDEIINLYDNGLIDFYFEERMNVCMELLKEKDEICDIKVSDFILEHYKDKRLFVTQNHLTPYFNIWITNQILERLNIPLIPNEYSDTNILESNCVYDNYNVNFYNFSHDTSQIFNNKETKDKIAEYNLDLQEAKGSGKDNKVRKYQNKIQEEERKLESLLQELSELG